MAQKPGRSWGGSPRSHWRRVVGSTSSGGGSRIINDRRRGRSDFFAAYEAYKDAGLDPRISRQLAWGTGRTKHIYLTTICATMATGTTEVARNSIVIMGLELSREPKENCKK